MPDIFKPHDKLFKRSLQQKKIMIDWLAAHLPAAHLALIDTASLALAPTEFIPKWPESLYSDVVYSCTLAGQPGYLYLAAEHQSKPEKMMAFRVLRYVVELMQNHLQQGHKKLPLVLPLMLYHGAVSPYPHSTAIWDCFEDPQLAQQWALRPFQLIDLTVQSNADINQHGFAAAMEMLLKNYREQKTLAWLQQLLADNKMTKIYAEISRDYFDDVLRYFIQVCGKAENSTHSEELEKSLALWVKAVPQAKENIMTFAEQLRQQGRQQGRQEGMQAGRQEGMQAGRQEGIHEGEKIATLKLARTLLASGVERSTIKLATGLSDAELDQPAY